MGTRADWSTTCYHDAVTLTGLDQGIPCGSCEHCHTRVLRYCGIWATEEEARLWAGTKTVHEALAIEREYLESIADLNMED